MRSISLAYMLFGLLLWGCGEAGEEAPDDSAATPEIPQYSAEAFFETTSYSLASGDGYAFSADDTRLLVTSDETGIFNAYALDPASGERTRLTNSESDAVFALSWFPADDRILFTRDSGGNERNHVFVRERDTSPDNVYVAGLPDGEARKLTEALNPAIAEEHLVAGEVVRFASYDGLDIPGILYKPHQAGVENPVPAMVWVHGGPGGQSRKGYRATIQHLVNHGYAVFAINNRGSSGYGKTFFHRDDKRHGEADLGDVVASRDFLASQDWIDGETVGIIGGSYGGYMVAAALAFEPEAFDVGIDIFGVTNWVRTLKQIPDWWAAQREALYDELGDPVEEEERLRRISPLFHAENITKPLLVVQGANDPRVHQVESDELVAEVRSSGVPVEYIVFDDEGHGFRNRSNRIEASTAYIAFLDRYLKGDGADG